MMSTTPAQLIATLEQTPQKLKHISATLTDARLDFRPSPDAWSIREILAHLVDDEMFVIRTRTERMVKEESPALAPHDEKKWYSQRNTSRDAINDLLNDFASQRAASLGILKFLRESEWSRTGYQPEYGHFTIQEWVGRWIEHDQTHIKQIEQNIALYSDDH